MSNPFDSSELLAPRRVLVLGDFMLDQYTWGRADRVSPEAPVLVVQAETCEVRLGGAGAVAGLLRGLEADVRLAGILGDDPEGRIVRQLLDEAGIDSRLVLTDAERPTTHKQRFLATVEQRQPHQILRVDHERTHPLTTELVDSLAGAIDNILLWAGLRTGTDNDRRSRQSGRPTAGGFVDRIKYGYDRNGNRTYRENTVATAAGAYFDEKYLHDLIDRLKSMDRGRLSDLKSQVQNLQFAQRWGLDATGNWRSFLEDSDGNGTWDLDQTRTANKVNEIADITEGTGPSWFTPACNRAGNMTTVPKPADPTQSFTATYDAWNRLVRIEEGANTVGEYEYDGAKRRTVKKTYVSGQLDETRHFFYTAPSRWQVVEERVGSSTGANRHFVWGLRYVDDLVLRNRDTNSDGTLDERLYGMQDGNWNVTSIAATGSSVQERYAYHPYGTPIVLTTAFGPRGSSQFDWETTFAGYQWDASVMLLSVRNRVYAAVFGAWLQRDPISSPVRMGPVIDRGTSSSNAYSYGDAPINWTDPSGLVPMDATFTCKGACLTFRPFALHILTCRTRCTCDLTAASLEFKPVGFFCCEGLCSDLCAIMVSCPSPLPVPLALLIALATSAAMSACMTAALRVFDPTATCICVPP